MNPSRERYDVVVVGGGHNGLTAAAYLARAGKTVLVLERLPHTGGAAVSAPTFSGRPPRLSRYSYLVSLLPHQIVADLALDIELRSRSTASYTPYVRDGVHGGLLVERPEGPATRESFLALTGDEGEYDAWRTFHADVASMARVVAPTLLQELPTERAIRSQVDAAVWDELVVRPLGESLERRFRDDTVRGVVATDALIGTFASLHDPSLAQNRCFLYHVLGNGTGEWKLPVGGMGAVTDALWKSAAGAGAEILLEAGVRSIEADGASARVTWDTSTSTHSVDCDHVLAGVAPWVLRILLGAAQEDALKPSGSQLKINLLLERLPQLRSGADPAVAFAGTLHLGEGYSDLEAAYAAAAAGRIPPRIPGEVYCHSLSHPSLLDVFPGHTLTYFGLHTPAALYDDPGARERAVSSALATLNSYLAEPIESCLARDADGRPCLEVKTPQDIEADLAMPGGHIFHGDLEWPWAPNRAHLSSPAQRWGVATDIPTVLLCGSGARRGGGVSGVGGHNAAMALLEG